MIEVLDLLDSRIGYIKEYSDLKTVEKFDSWPDLSFTVPADETNLKLIQNELRLRYGGEVFVIKDFKPGRDNSGLPTLKVTSPLIAIDLNHKPRQVVGTWIGSEIYSNWSPSTHYKVFDRIKYYGVIFECRIEHTSGASLTGNQWSYWTTCNFQAELAEVVLTVTETMTLALADTGWTPGAIDDDGASRTFSGEWVSVTSLLQEIAEKFDKHIVYHSSTLTVDMVDEPGLDHNVTIEYGKNLTGITKSAESTDFVTKLFLYGDEELTVNDVNIHGPEEHLLYQLQDNQSFILNFAYFISQGYTEDQIYTSVSALGDSSPFIRIGQLKLDSYVDEAVLLAEGIKQLAEELSIPKVSYQVSFFDLVEVLADANEDIGLGDWITIRDLGLGVDVKVRVVGLTMVPGSPEDSSADLSNANEFFGNSIASTVQYNSRLSQNDAINNLMKRFINTATTTINSSKGDLIWKDGQLTAVELTEDGEPTGNQVRLTPGGVGVSTDFGATYGNAITGAGVLAEKIIADSLHILSIGPDGILIEPQTSGVRLNNTEGIVVQSADKRFAARMRASDEMGGTSYGFSLWNGEFEDITISQESGFFKIDVTLTDIPYVADYYVQVDANGRWYIFRKTTLLSTGPCVLTEVGGHLYIDGVDSGYDYEAGLLVEAYGGYWYVGADSGVVAVYTGDSLVFGVSMNGDAYFKGEVQATSGDFSGIVRASQFFVDGVDILDLFLVANQATSELTIGNITFNGLTGNISMTGNLDLGGDITISGNIEWNSSNAPVKYQFSINGSTNWHTDMVEADFYRRESLDGGTTWGSAYQFRGVEGAPGSDGSDASVTRANIIAALVDTNPNDGIYSYDIGGVNYLGIKTTYLSAIAAQIQDLQFGTWGHLRNDEGSDGVGATDLSAVQSSKSIVLDADQNIRLSPGAAYGLYLDSTIDDIFVGGIGNFVTLSSLLGSTVAVFG